MTLKQKLKNFICHPAINASWLAEQLYGDKSSKNRKKISLKIAEKQNFNETEIQTLTEIRKNFLKDIK